MKIETSPVMDLVEAEKTGAHHLFLRSPSGDVSVGEFATLVRGLAAHLSEMGISPGDRVAVVGPNGVQRVVSMFAVWWVGAVEVSVNFELRGDMLRHVLHDSEPSFVLCEESLVGHVQLEVGEAVVITYQSDQLRPSTSFSSGLGGDRLDRAGGPSAPGDLGTILYTSGTSGPAKGVMLPRAYFSQHAKMWIESLAITAGDVGYFPLPFFHVDAHVVLSACLRSQSALAFPRKFSVSRFWEDVEEMSATWVAGVGSMFSMIASRPTPDQAPPALRRLIGAPIPEIAYEVFEDRLGLDVLSMYGQTECDAVAMESSQRRCRDSAGQVNPSIELQIVDENDEQVGVDVVGQIVFRPREPHFTALGYWRRPEFTVSAWRNLWFHSGDTGRLDSEGFLHFVGRQTDSFRRRGENISAWELESSLSSGPGVHECVAVAVEDEHGGEDEIKVFVVPVDESIFDLAAFVDFCQSAIPRFARPRYLCVTTGSEFVRSPGTGVVQKRLLSRSTDSPETVDVTAFAVSLDESGK